MSGLRAFRDRLHGCFTRRADALFELCEAILTASSVPSPAHLSLEAVHRRGWGSLYAALSKGGVDEGALRGPRISDELVEVAKKHGLGRLEAAGFRSLGVPLG